MMKTEKLLKAVYVAYDAYSNDNDATFRLHEIEQVLKCKKEWSNLGEIKDALRDWCTDFGESEFTNIGYDNFVDACIYTAEIWKYAENFVE